LETQHTNICLSELHYGFCNFSEPTWNDGRQLTVTQLVSFDARSSQSGSSNERMWYFFLWEDGRTMDLVYANCRTMTLSAQIQRRRGPCAVPCYFWSVLVTRNWCVSGRAEAGGPTYTPETEFVRATYPTDTSFLTVSPHSCICYPLAAHYVSNYLHINNFQTLIQQRFWQNG